MNDCLKQGIKLAKYFYRGNEDGLIHLNYDNVTSSTSVRRKEKRCFERCEKNFCVLTVLSGTKGNGRRLTVSRMKSTLSSTPRAYWIQMTGLVFFFFGVCCHQLAFQMIRLLCGSKRYKRLLILQILLLLLFLLVLLIFVRQLLADYLTEMKHPSPKFSVKYLSAAYNLSLVICVPVIHTLNGYNDELLHRSAAPSHLAYLLAQHELKELNFSELESETDEAFDETVDEIYLEVLGRREAVFWELTDRVLFMLVPDTLLFSRCFQIAVNLSGRRPRYEAFLSATKLSISLKHHLYALYLVPDDQAFHSASYRHDKLVKYTKKKYTFPSETCSDYRTAYHEGRSKCNSFANCVDQCAQEELIKAKRNASVYGLIDKRLFSADQWSGLFPDFSKQALQSYNQTKAKCDQLLKGECGHIFYDRANETETDFNTLKLVENVKIYYELINTGIELPSDLKLLFDFLNVVGILFDLNVLQLLTMALLYFKIKFKLNATNKVWFQSNCSVLLVFSFMFACCSTKSATMTWCTVSTLTNSRLSNRQSFCFDFDFDRSAINETGDRLAKVTRQMTTQTVFQKIQYLTGENEWKGWKEWKEWKEATNATNDVRIDSLFLYHKKCFRIRINVQYELRQFYFDGLEDLVYYPVLKVDFNHSFTENHAIVFFTKNANEMLLSEPTYLNWLLPNII